MEPVRQQRPCVSLIFGEDEDESLREMLMASGAAKPLPGAQYGKCSGKNCGRKIIWIEVEDPTGIVQGGRKHRIPLDPVRVRLWIPPDDTQSDPHWRKGGLGYVPHHKTCPDVDRFKKNA